jgi:hypothetical protein
MLRGEERNVLAGAMALDVVDSPGELIVIVDKVEHLPMDVRDALHARKFGVG